MCSSSSELVGTLDALDGSEARRYVARDIVGVAGPGRGFFPVDGDAPCLLDTELSALDEVREVGLEER
jgi:hypothetical protein